MDRVRGYPNMRDAGAWSLGGPGASREFAPDGTSRPSLKLIPVEPFGGVGSAAEIENHTLVHKAFHRTAPSRIVARAPYDRAVVTENTMSIGEVGLGCGRPRNAPCPSLAAIVNRGRDVAVRGPFAGPDQPCEFGIGRRVVT
jgi:hypothetical protein